MKKIIMIIGVLLVSLPSFSQIKFKFPDSRVLNDINGGVIDRGDEFDVLVHANGNGNTTTRQLLFDFQYDQTNFEIVSINHTGTGGNGGILPQGSNPMLSWYNYAGYGYAGNTTNTNGTTRYNTNVNYSFNTGSSNAIIRVTLTWSTTSGMPYSGYDRMIVVRFRLKSTSTATAFNPIKLNFVAGWTGSGAADATFMDSPLSTEIIMNQLSGKLVTANVDVNSNLLSVSALKVVFRDIITGVGQLFNVLSNGVVDINQSLLAENKTYEVSVMHEMDKLYQVYNNAITVSDFTTAQSEFSSMGLDGSNGQILKTGQSLYAADINRNRAIDGGDLPRLLGQVVSLDTLVTVPAGYSAGSGGWMSIPTWKETDATSIIGQTEWAYVTPNNYSSGVSRLSIDVREFSGNIKPENISSIQIFDLYSGPVEYVSSDGTWATYKIPSNLIKASDGTSTYLSYIRNVNNIGADYSLKSEWDFDNSPLSSWGAITATNWKDITYPKTLVKTGALGSNAVVNLKYLLWGDVNRSHSSQVVVMNSNGGTVLKTNAINSLSSNLAFKTMSTQNAFINTPNDIKAIDVILSNLTITSNSIEIPVAINTQGSYVSGLQFEFSYDPNKIKFEELVSSLPNTWYTFANAKTGKIKFGSIDQNKNPIQGSVTPFKLKFSTIGNGVDILTSVKISPIMDASSSNGTQLGISLNTTQIKLTGYNNF